MIFEGEPGGAQAESTRSGEGLKLIGGRTIHYPVWPETTGYRIQPTGQAYEDVDARMQD